MLYVLRATHAWIPDLEMCFPLRCLQQLSRKNVATQLALDSTAESPGIPPARSSRTVASFSQESDGCSG